MELSCPQNSKDEFPKKSQPLFQKIPRRKRNPSPPQSPKRRVSKKILQMIQKKGALLPIKYQGRIPKKIQKNGISLKILKYGFLPFQKKSQEEKKPSSKS